MNSLAFWCDKLDKTGGLEMVAIEYRELKSFDEFRECVSLQKEIFGVSDIDAFSPLILYIFSRESPSVGILIGAFDNRSGKQKQIGFFLGSAILRENAYWGILGGILPEYNGKSIGTELFRKLRELSLSRKVQNFYWTYDPLEGNLGHTNFNKLGHLGIEYRLSPFEYTRDEPVKNDIPIDNVVIKWELDSRRTCEKIGGTYCKEKIEDVLAKYPLVNEGNLKNDEIVLVEIPDDYAALKSTNFEEAMKWRFNTREIFSEYINNRGYWITEFYTQRENGKRRNFYQLEKQ
jgi:predicted GNAT superfamily acetyltransferase